MKNKNSLFYFCAYGEIKMSDKSAIVLFVKNEVYDIASWISWHLSLGFDKIFIYDDHSTDGTFEVCEIISRKYNIELNRTNIEKEPNFYWRQKESYFDACRKSLNNYKWLAFLDADEYIYLEEYNTINDFLLDYENCNAIALNWCIYGGSYKVLKDHIPIYQAFLFHSQKELDDNTLVKSIIKPEYYTFNYTDPHKFHLENEQYLDSLGNSFTWSGSTKKVEWGRARVNHYICRSMEHYVARINRRLGADLSNSTVYWNHFDKNDLEYHIEKSRIENANKILNDIKTILFDNYQETLILKNKFHNQVINSKEKKSKTFVIKTQHDSYLHLNSIDGFLAQTPDISTTNNPIYGIIYDEDPDTIYLVSQDNEQVSNINFHIKDKQQKSFCYRFQIVPSHNNSVFLKDPCTNKYLSCVPLDLGGDITCNRQDHSAWEQFSLIENSFQFDTLSSIKYYFNYQQFVDFLLKQNLNYNDFLIASSNLDTKSKELLLEESNKTLSWIV